jgi:acyl carrier protein
VRSDRPEPKAPEVPVPSPDALLEDLRRLMGEQFELAPEAVTLDARLADDLDLDSLDGVTLALRLEDELGVALEEDDFEAMDTVASVIAILRARLGERPGGDP